MKWYEHIYEVVIIGLYGAMPMATLPDRDEAFAYAQRLANDGAIRVVVRERDYHGNGDDYEVRRTAC